MLGKLIKYDLMADWKKYATLYAATLLVSIMLFTTGKIKENIHNNIILEIVEDMFGVVFTTLIVAIGVAVVVLTVMRFYKNVVRDEGYLTHTLPVHTWEILTSKLISAYIWFLSAFVIGSICIGIGMGEPLWPLDALEAIAETISDVPGTEEKSLTIQMITAVMGSVILSPFFIMTTAYFCFAVGNLSNSHKLGISVLTFFGVNIAENIIATIVMVLFVSNFDDNQWDTMSVIEALRMSNSIMVLTLIMSLAISAGFFVASERIFAKKLNLE
ncbi:MAG: hypothetical protein K2G87_01720 [Oscillospiraceae bacterium]|nr:hypothetical protein [Oscillospiraceae bacterium]